MSKDAFSFEEAYESQPTSFSYEDVYGVEQEKPSLLDRAFDTAKGLAQPLIRAFNPAAAELMKDHPRSVLETQAAINEIKRMQESGTYDPMLRPEFISEFRRTLSDLPAEHRLNALRQYAENDNSVYGRAARVILEQETAANRKVASNDRETVKTLRSTPTAKQGGSGGAAPFVEATPTFVEAAQGITAEEKARNEELARTVSGVREDIRINQQPVSYEAIRERVDRFAEENPLLAWAKDKAGEMLKGTAQGVKAFVDLFGAGSRASDAVESIIRDIETRQSSAQAQLNQERGQIIESAGDGVVNQLKAAARAMAVDPAGLILNSVGTMAPMLVAGELLSGVKAVQWLGSSGAKLIGRAGSATSAATAGSAVAGAAMGAGFAKSAIYDSVYELARKDGYTDEEAKQIAVRAQSYTENPDVIALVAVLTAGGSATGSEPMILAMFTKNAAKDLMKKGIVKSVGGAILKDVPLEAAQGGSETFAGNVGANRAGFDVAPGKGVMANAFLEGGTAGVIAGTIGAAESGGRLRDETPQEYVARMLSEQMNANVPLATQSEIVDITRQESLNTGGYITPASTSRAAATAEQARLAGVQAEQAKLAAMRATQAIGAATSVDEAIANASQALQAGSAATRLGTVQQRLTAQADADAQLEAALNAVGVTQAQTAAEQRPVAQPVTQPVTVEPVPAAQSPARVVFATEDEAREAVAASGVDPSQLAINETEAGFVVSPVDVSLTERTPEGFDRDLNAVVQLRRATNLSDMSLVGPASMTAMSQGERKVVRQLELMNAVLRTMTGKEVVLVKTEGAFLGVANNGRYFVNVKEVAKTGDPFLVAGATLFHEAVHTELEQSQDPAIQAKYQELKRVILAYQKAGKVDQRMALENRGRAKMGAALIGRDGAESEFVADVSGAMMISDPEFWARVYDIDGGSTLRRIGYKFMQYLTRLITKVRGDSRFNVDALIKQREQVREALAQAWAARAQSNNTPFGPVKFDPQFSPARRTGMRDATPEDYKAFKIPPAYKQAQVTTDPESADLQWTAIDSKGRKKYGYTDAYIRSQKGEKFERMQRFYKAVPALMARIEQDAAKGDERALVLRLIALTGFRVGGDPMRSGSEAFGASTLEPRHVSIDGDRIDFDFIGKGGVRQQHTIEDAMLAEAIAERMGRPKLFNTSDERVRIYLKLISKDDFKVHDFRTYVATTTAKMELDARPIPTSAQEFWDGYTEAIKRAAQKIGDTETVAEQDYVDPSIFDEWRAAAGVASDAKRPRARNTKARARTAVVGQDSGSRQDDLRGAQYSVGEVARPGILAEVAPNPDQTEVTQQWRDMTDAERLQATRDVARRVVDKLSYMTGIKGWDITISSGTYEGTTNPNFILTAPDGVTFDQASEFASLLGYVLDQKAMVVFDESNTSGPNVAGFVKVVLPKGFPESKLRELRSTIRQMAPAAGDDTLRDGALVFGNFRDPESGQPFSGLTDDEFRSQIEAAVQEFDRQTGGEWTFDVRPTQYFRSDLIWPDNRDAYLEGTRYASDFDALETGRDGVRGRSGGDLAELRRLAEETIARRQSWIDNSAAGRQRQQRARELAAQRGGEVAAERDYGTARDGSTSVVGVHFSRQRRKVLSSSFYGTGLRGAEAERLSGPANADLRQRIYFYVDAGNGIQPEAGVGGVKHAIRLNNLYDMNRDPLGLVASARGADTAELMNARERTIMQAGFDGYLADTGAKQKFAVLLGKHNIEMPQMSVSDDFDYDYIDIAQQIDVDETEIEAESMWDVKRELMAKGFAVNVNGESLDADSNWSAVSDKEIKAQGVFAENAFPEPRYYEDQYGQASAIVEIAGRNRELLMRGKDGEYFAMMNGLRIEGDGAPLQGKFKTEAAAYAYLERHAAGIELRARKFDLYKAVPKAAAERIGKFWTQIAQISGATEFDNAPLTNLPEKSLAKLEVIAKARLVGKPWEVSIDSYGSYLQLEFQHKITGEVGSGVIEINRGRLVLHSTEAGKGAGVGKMFYNIANTFAKVIGYPVYADPQGLTAVNTVRRTENGMSIAARFGGEANIVPGVGQRVYGFNENAKTPAQKQQNLVRLALAQMRNVFEVLPDAADLRYDLDGGRLTLNGADAEDRVSDMLKNHEARTYSIGRTSLVRAALTNELIKNDIPVPQSVKEPVLYSVAIDDPLQDAVDAGVVTPQELEDFGTPQYAVLADLYESDFRNRYVQPEIEGFTFENGNLARLPSAMIRGTLVLAGPIRIQVGEHHSTRSAGTDMPMFGAQHRIGNKRDKGRSYLVNLDGADGSGEVESAVRDMLASVVTANMMYLDADTVKKGGEARKVYLYSNKLGRLTVLRRGKDSENNRFWGVATVYNVDRSGLSKLGSGLPIGGETPNRDDQQRIIGVAEGLAKSLLQPSQFLPQPGALILDKDGLIVKRWEPVTPSSVAVMQQKPKRNLLRDENGRIILNKNKAGFSVAGDIESPRLKRQFGKSKVVDAAAKALDAAPPVPRDDYAGRVVSAGLPDTIEVDGVQRPTRNSNGQPIHPTEEGIRSFWRWFGDSKVVDEQGRPLVVFHGTDADIEAFDAERSKDAGVWFTPVAGAAEMYSGSREGANIIPAYVSLQNPYEAKVGESRQDALDKAIDRGHDGIIVRDSDGSISTLAAFKPTQIKSATGNRGTFDPNSPDIRFSLSGLNFDLDDMGFWRRWQRAMQDYFVRVQQVQEAIAAQGGKVTEANDTYRAEERSYGRINEAMKDFAEQWVKPMMEKAAAAKVDLDELSLYAYAMHAKERNAYIASINPNMPDGGSGMTNAEADAILNQFKADPRFQSIQDLHGDLMAITATIRRMLLEEGLITEQEYQNLEGMYENYVPLRGFEDESDPRVQQILQEGGARRGTGRGFSIKGKETMAALGRRTRAGQILENIIHDYGRAVVRGEKNQVARAFYQFVLDNPDPKLWEIDANKTRRSLGFDANGNRVVRERVVLDTNDNTTIAVKINGNEVFIKVRDPDLVRALKKMHNDEMGEQMRTILHGLSVYTSLLRNTLTRWNPEFAIVNLIRDAGFGTLAVLDELGEAGVAKFWKHYAAANMAAHRYEMGTLDPINNVADRYFQEYRAAGGTTGGFYLKDADEIMRDMRDMMLAAGAEPKDWTEKLKSKRSPYHLAKKAGRVLEHIGAVSENAARAAAYRAAREMGKSPAEAAKIAKNLTTNFNRKGEYGQMLNTLYVFYNAAIQGSARTIQLAKNPKVQKYLAGISASSFALALMAAWGAGDDPDDGEAYWDKIPQHVKERNLIIMVPPGLAKKLIDQFGEDGLEQAGTNGYYIAIPVQYGLNVFTTLGYTLADNLRHYTEGKHRGYGALKGAANMASVMFGSFNPFGGSVDNKHAAAMLVLPSVFDPVYQLATGTNAFGTPVAPFKSDMDAKPNSENVNARQAGGPAHKLARFINEVTGGDDTVPGSVDISPGTIENVVYNLTGSTGRFLNDVLHLVLSGLDYANGGDPDLYVKQVPVFRKVFGVVDGSVDQGLFYDRRRLIQEARQEQKSKEEAGREVTNPKTIGYASMASDANKYTRALSDIRKQMIAIGKDPDMSPTEKRTVIRELKAERDALTREFNKQWIELIKAIDAGEFE